MTRTKETAPFPLNEMPNGRVLGWRFEQCFFISWAPDPYLQDPFLTGPRNKYTLWERTLSKGWSVSPLSAIGAPHSPKGAFRSISVERRGEVSPGSLGNAWSHRHQVHCKGRATHP